MRKGGSFAPPLTDELLARYEHLATIDATPAPVRDAMATCLRCVKHWWELPESGPDGSHEHPSGRGTIVPLDKPIAEALYDDIPWDHEIESMKSLFGTLPKGELSNAAHHLLWHVVELNKDREPITNDRL